ncbi:MAG TPA: hypothetical protein DCQ68_05760 [Chryseobacterium indologenes]|nr:hypothetical protein [Chryseobacterium indologenes]
MATYESLIKIKGAVGDLVFYNLNGKNVVRKKSGFNKKAFKKNASYEKVRQNSSEFGLCSKMGKIIRKSLDFYIKEAGDTLLYQKFAKLMTEIKDADTISERGKRTVVNGLTTEKGKKLLKNFQMGKIENISAQAEMKDRVLYLNENNGDSQATIICIKLDSVNYTAESTAEKISPLQPEVQFKKQFSEEDFLLYFVVLEKNNEISNMGFV